jgi:hypothetical protein
MKFQNYPSVLNRKESFSIKEFMNEGRGRRKNALSSLSKVGDTPSLKFRAAKTYSVAFNPLMLFDPTFILIGAGVVLVAFIEKQLASNGFVFLAAAIDSILKIAFPLVAVGSMIYLLSHSSFLL